MERWTLRKADSLKIDFSGWTLPLVGTALLLLSWSLLGSTWSTSVSAPQRTWEVSRLYVLAPLGLVAKGCILALLVGTPVGFVIGVHAIPVAYLNIATVLQLSPCKRLTPLLISSALPFI